MSSVWSLLGIEPTSDKEEIHRAYRARYDSLADGSSISRYAELNAARDKALFIASQSEIGKPAPEEACRVGSGSREGDRSEQEEIKTDRTTEPVPEEEQEPKPEFQVEIEEDILKEPPVQTGTGVIEDWPGTEEDVPAAEPKTYIDPSYHAQPTVLKVGPSHTPSSASPHTLERAVPTFAFWVAGILAVYFVADLFFPDAHLGEQEDRGPVVAERMQDFGPSLVNEHHEETLAALLGDDIDFDTLYTLNPHLAYELHQATSRDNRVAEGRSVLRVRLLEARSAADLEKVVAINSLYLDWLRQGLAAGGGQCLEVASWSFFDGVPVMEDEALEREREVARSVFLNSAVPIGDDNFGSYSLPPNLVDRVADRTGMTSAEVSAALTNFADESNCKVRIAFLELMMANPSEAPYDLLTRL